MMYKNICSSKENNFALPAVNCVGTDSINAVLEAAAVRSPVIVQFSNGGAAFKVKVLKLKRHNKRLS